MSFLKPKGKQAENNNLGLINSIYTPQAQQGALGTNYLSALLTGQGDTAAAQGGYDEYLKNAGYDNALRRMSQSVVGGGAASGLLRSGSTENALLQKGSEINQGYYNNYLSQLSGLAGIGNQSGQTLASAGSGGGYSSPSTGGVIAGIGGKLLGSIFSDRRLKEDIVLVNRLPDGLGIYDFRYKTDLPEAMRPYLPANLDQRQIGFMADEVERLRPWALGPVVDGFQTVNYGAL